jgi:carboxyl-terminal processing protease
LPAELTGDDKIGYIRLEQFGENTAQEFEDALTKLEGEGMQALVLDLRNNPGGLLDSAVEVAGKFLPPGQVVVSTQGRLAEQNFEYRARGAKRHPNYPIAVLINGYSASGAEIVAGALKDLGRAVLVGETTFGKGSVQSVQDLGNGIGMRLTTAKYYTPSKRVIHQVGVSPDISAPISETEERELTMARQPQLLTAEEQQEVRNLRDTQLERAIGSLKSIRIFIQRQQQQLQAQPAAPVTAPAPAEKKPAEGAKQT